MQAYISLAPTAIDGSGSSSNRNLSINPWINSCWGFSCRTAGLQRHNRRPWGSVIASASIDDQQQNHYAVLGVSLNASSSDIKRAYRLLALKVT